MFRIIFASLTYQIQLIVSLVDVITYDKCKKFSRIFEHVDLLSLYLNYVFTK